MSSNYPGGFANGVTIRGVPISVSNPGESFWVNGSGVLAKGGVGGSDGNDGSYRRPFATLDYAIGKCTASRGDVIYLMPGHAENVASAGAITADVIGVTVIGLGAGTLQPALTFTAAAADVLISATDVSFYNVRFTANFVDVLAGIDINSNNAGFYNCKFTDTGTNLNYLVVMNVADGVDDLTLDGCTYIGKDAQNDNVVQAAGTHDNFIIRNNFFIDTVAKAAGEGMIEVATLANNFIIEGNRFHSETAAVDNAFVTIAGTANTGWAVNNYLSSVDGDATAANFLGSFDVTGLGNFGNLAVADADANAVSFLTDEDLT
jgi:hypothetical protein